MSKPVNFECLDALYGDISFGEPLVSLQKLPVIQRLRHVRLSNIDSVSTPGVAGCSRYEHAIGTAYLALRAGIMQYLSEEERYCFLSAAMLHDSAITPYGHLVEEAMQYIGKSVDHEEKWAILLADAQTEAGGVDLQVYCGRESGLRHWAYEIFESRSEIALDLIFQIIKGIGPLGECVASKLDIDNLDNVPRAAYHMGLLVDRDLPIRIAKGMQLSDDHKHLVFSEKVISDIKTWLDLRRAVYDKFMLSADDFAGKIMLLSATLSALKLNIIHREDWKMTDNIYLNKLLACDHESVSQPLKRWLLYDLWSMSTLMWFHGSRPDYTTMRKFGEILTEKLKRHCFAYGIQDKRAREIVVNLRDRASTKLGFNSNKWVLGVASSKKERFSSNQNRELVDIALEDFGWQPLGTSAEQCNLPFFRP